METNRRGSGDFYYAAVNGSQLFYPLYDAASRPLYLSRFNTGAAAWQERTGYSWDAVGRLADLTLDLAGTSHDTTTTFTYNPASQIASSARTNDLYAWNGGVNVNRAYTSNGLNQYSAVAGTGVGYDANGNLTSDGTNSYVYDVENRLVSRGGGGSTASLKYDPLGRLYEVTGSATGTTRFLYDGNDLVAEYNAGGSLLRRYVHGAGSGDDPLVWFEGSGVADSARRYLHADERGSVVAVTDSSGNVLNLNTYDEYGIPGASNTGRSQYTGQTWLPELGLYYYKARMYSPTLGRFMQTDPIGYGDGMNMYAYVGADPVNAVDPSGLSGVCWTAGVGNSWSGYWSCPPGVHAYSYDDFGRGGVNHPEIPPAPYTCAVPAMQQMFPEYCSGPQPPQNQTPQQPEEPQSDEAQQKACGSGIFAAALRRRDVQSAISDSIQMGMDKRTSVRAPVETGFTFGRVIGGGRGVTSVHTSGQRNRIDTKSWLGQMEDAGIYDAEIFFHFDPAGAPLSGEDIGLVGPAIYGQGFSGVVTYGKDGVPYCYGN